MMQFIFDVLIRTSDIMLVTVGLSLVYSLVKFPNVAHVQYAMIGAFATLGLIQVGLPFWLATILSCILTGLLTVFLNTFVFKRLLRSGSANALIGSLAVSMILIAVVLAIAGSRAWRYTNQLTSPLRFGSVVISVDQIWSIVCGIACITILAFLLYRTSIGRSMRATASNPDLAAATGVNSSKVVDRITFISGALAALGGTMLGLTESVQVDLGNNLLLPVFAAAILGGLGNPLGAAASALLISMAETVVTNVDFGWLTGATSYYLPITYLSAAPFLILIVTLLFRPYGIFDNEVRRV